MKQISDEVDCDKSTVHSYDEIYPIFLEQFRNIKFNVESEHNLGQRNYWIL